MGLLDSGAQVSVVGPRFKAWVDNGLVQTKASKYSICTADGAIHSTKHALILPVRYCNQIREIEAPLFESLSHDLVLGVDFWSLFSIRPAVVEVGSIEAPKQISVSDNLDLSAKGAEELQKVLKKMPFGKDGILSKTSLIKHTIDTGSAIPIKQTQCIMSP